MATKPPDPVTAAMRLAESQGMIRVRDAEAQGIHREVLRRLTRQGRLVRVSRGTYAPASADPSTHLDLAVAATRVPGGVVCLLSALSYHEIGTQLPHEVWMMIDRRSHRPRIHHPPMRYVRGSGANLTLGVEEVSIDGVPVRIFNPAKTIVDCFRYRRHVGLEAALEALRTALADRRVTPSEIDLLARTCRVQSVLRPYLEALA